MFISLLVTKYRYTHVIFVTSTERNILFLRAQFVVEKVTLVSARDFFFLFFKLVSSKRFSKGPSVRFFYVVVKREKAIRHIE